MRCRQLNVMSIILTLVLILRLCHVAFARGREGLFILTSQEGEGAIEGVDIARNVMKGIMEYVSSYNGL